MNDNKYAVSINTINAIIDLKAEAERLYEDPEQTILLTTNDLQAVYNAADSMTRTAKPAAIRDVKDALINAKPIKPSEIDIYIPHRDTPKTTARFMKLAKDGLPHLKGLWLLTDYSSNDICYSGPEIIIDTVFDKEDIVNQRLRLDSAIAKHFLYHEWRKIRLKEDVLREGKTGFDLRLVREILEGRVRRIYLEPSIEREGQNNEQ